MSTAGTVLIGGRWEHRDGRLTVTAPGDGSVAGEIDWADGGAEEGACVGLHEFTDLKYASLTL